MRVVIIHNNDAGRGVYDATDLRELFRARGHEASSADRESGAIHAAIDARPDAIVASGGDGTIAKVAIALLGSDVPLVILPTGTANNIARAVGSDGPIQRLIALLDRPRAGSLAVGRITAPGLDEYFVEAVGVGFVGRMLTIAEQPLPRLSRALRGWWTGPVDQWYRAARGVGGLVRRQPVRPLGLVADGEDLSGDYVTVEVLNIDAIGPRIRLAPDAVAGDGVLDLALVRESHREPLARYIESRAGPEVPVPIELHRVRRVELEWPSIDAHIDDAVSRSTRHDENERAIIEVAGSVQLLLPST